MNVLPGGPGTVVGIYNSRAIAVAFAGSAAFDRTLGVDLAFAKIEYDRAEARGDQQRMQEIEATFETRQKTLHDQVFEKAPVDDILGLLMSAITRSQVAAVFVTAIICMVPTMQFSGMLQPISTLEGPARVIGSLWPTGNFVHLSVGSFTKGLGLAELSSDLLWLLLYAPVFTLCTALLLRKQER